MDGFDCLCGHLSYRWRSVFSCEPGSQSEFAVGAVKWAAILFQALCTLVAIAMVHADNRRACAITLTLFATGVALSVLLIAAYSRPFTGEISVTPELLKQVIATEAKGDTSR